ncbi:DUF6361 family protein [Ruminococcaceae bacterium OttesenSCG-928-D13]|nr:DUF6361 family protein [Ruminococcaceae bacterium OttesenSCG-928-D13]
MLSLGWVDFSKRDRDMVLNVLRQLTEPGAVDELGIGTIRDGFANILFPGTSTIQTRAKYLFIIPYICLELDRDKKLLPRDFINALEQNELDLIDVLAVNGAEGVIGQRSRQTLRRKPSSIYWNALRTYGFLTEPVTLSEYAALSYTRKNTSEQQKRLGKRKARYEDDSVDDSDMGMSGTSFWRVPTPEKNWRDTLTIDLTAEEATYLRGQILSMPGTRDSLFALILREDRRDFTEYQDFDDIDALQGLMPPQMLGDYQLARDFSRFIFGAQVRYNVIYSGGQNENANERWELYLQERPTVNLSEIQARLKPRSSVMRFLKAYQNAIDDEKTLDRLIVAREESNKGKARSKLINKELYQYHDDSVNMVPLTYRLSNVQRIGKDIFEGVERHA